MISMIIPGQTFFFRETGLFYILQARLARTWNAANMISSGYTLF